MFDNEFLNILFWALIGFGTLAVSVIWGIREEKRKRKLRQQEAEYLANLSPELQQRHIEINQQGQQFQFDFVLFILASIFIAALIYFLNWEQFS